MVVAITCRIVTLIKLMKERYKFLLFSLRNFLAVITKPESQASWAEARVGKAAGDFCAQVNTVKGLGCHRSLKSTVGAGDLDLWSVLATSVWRRKPGMS